MRLAILVGWEHVIDSTNELPIKGQAVLHSAVLMLRITRPSRHLPNRCCLWCLPVVFAVWCPDIQFIITLLQCHAWWQKGERPIRSASTIITCRFSLTSLPWCVSSKCSFSCHSYTTMLADQKFTHVTDQLTEKPTGFVPIWADCTQLTIQPAQLWIFLAIVYEFTMTDDTQGICLNMHDCLSQE